MIRYRLACEALSPIHIGSGSEIEPLDYIIRGNRLYLFSMNSFVSKLTDSERARFEAVIDSGDLISVRKFLFDNADVEKCAAYSVEVSAGVAGRYRAKLQDVQNQLMISPFIRDTVSGRPFIPGSSLKGAIRTALVSAAALKRNLPPPAGAS